MNPDARPTVTSETTLVELTRMLARNRIRLVNFKLDADGYFLKAESDGRFYVGLSEHLHLCFAQILDEIGAGANPTGAAARVRASRVSAPASAKQTCRWCGDHAVLVMAGGTRRGCVKGPGFCEPRGRGHRGPDKQPRRPKVEPSP